MWGLVEVYGDLFQDLAALQNIELLPWGWYGLATDKSGIGETALIDRLAGISSSADAQAFEELRSMIAEDDRLRPPGDDALKAIVSRERAAASNWTRLVAAHIQTGPLGRGDAAGSPGHRIGVLVCGSVAGCSDARENGWVRRFSWCRLWPAESDPASCVGRARQTSPGEPARARASFPQRIAPKAVIESGSQTAISTPGCFAGTPEFASPEQFAGLGVDIRSDLYSLGVVLWNMVTGHALFRGSGSPAEVMYQHQHALSPIQQSKDVPQPVAILLEVLLEKDPAQRFQTPTELLKMMPTITEAIDLRRTIPRQILRKRPLPFQAPELASL
jgi:Protein kinase domain